MDLTNLVERIAEQSGGSVEQVNTVAGWVAIAIIYVGLLLVGRGTRHASKKAWRGVKSAYAWAFVAPPLPPVLPEPPRVPVFTELGRRICAVLASRLPADTARWKRSAEGKLVAQIPNANGRCTEWRLLLNEDEDGFSVSTPLEAGDVEFELEGFDGSTLTGDDREAIDVAARDLYVAVVQRLDAELLPAAPGGTTASTHKSVGIDFGDGAFTHKTSATFVMSSPDDKNNAPLVDPLVNAYVPPADIKVTLEDFKRAGVRLAVTVTTMQSAEGLRLLSRAPEETERDQWSWDIGNNCVLYATPNGLGVVLRAYRMVTSLGTKTFFYRPDRAATMVIVN